MGKSPTHSVWCHHWVGGPGFYKKKSRLNKSWKQVNKQCLSMPSVSFSASSILPCLNSCPIFDDELLNGTVIKNKPFPPQVLLVIVLHHNTSKPKISIKRLCRNGFSLLSFCLPPCENKARKHSSDAIIGILALLAPRTMKKCIYVLNELHSLGYPAIAVQTD